MYGPAEEVVGERVTELTRPLLLAYLHPDDAIARWNRINAGDTRAVIIMRPGRLAGRQNVR